MRWWEQFFDETYATVGLRGDAEQIEPIVAFLRRHLRLEPGTVVLDQCCGIGRLSLPLARCGIRVIGVDLTDAYVERARRAAASEGLECRFECGDARSFTSPEPCDAAFNWFSSFGYDEDDGENRRMLERVFASLRPGGRFAIDFMNVPRTLAGFHRWWVERRDTDAGELLVLVEAEPDFARGMIEGVWTFLHPDGRREVRRVATRMLMPHELVRLLQSVGFTGIELVGSVDDEPYGLQTPRLIAVAEKRPR